MLLAEAQWFGRQMAAVPPEKLYPLCNVGSSTREFREEAQPWIDRYLFAPARAIRRRVTHVDLFQAPGVDLPGDLNDAEFLARLAAEGFRGLVCANLLEHVADPARMARDLLGILPSGGFLFVSVPHRFPYHPDPIDTMFRPSPSALAQLFLGTEILAQEVVRGGTMLHYVLGRAMRPRALWKSLRRGGGADRRAESRPEGTAEPAPSNPSPWRYVPWLVKQFAVSCVALRKL